MESMQQFSTRVLDASPAPTSLGNEPSAATAGDVRRERTRMEESERHPSLLLDLLIVAIAGGLLVATSKFGLEAGRPAARGAGTICGGVYLLYLGLLFLLSYFFPRRSFILSFLGYLCQESSRPAGRAMAWFYFALSVLFGSALLLAGMGAL